MQWQSLQVLNSPQINYRLMSICMINRWTSYDNMSSKNQYPVVKMKKQTTTTTTLLLWLLPNI